MAVGDRLYLIKLSTAHIYGYKMNSKSICLPGVAIAIVQVDVLTILSQLI